MECSCTVPCSFNDLYFDPDTTIIEKGGYQSPKERSCDECGRTMEPNEKHFRTLADHENDGRVSYRQCNDCDEIISVFFEEYPIGAVWETLSDSISSCDIVATENCISQLSPGNRARVCEMVEWNWQYEEMDHAE